MRELQTAKNLFFGPPCSTIYILKLTQTVMLYSEAEHLYLKTHKMPAQ